MTMTGLRLAAVVFKAGFAIDEFLFRLADRLRADDVRLGGALQENTPGEAGRCAAMTLVDTTDGVLMLGAYGWAFVKPIRKLYYNMTITFVSVLVALLIGGIEALGLVADRLDLEGPFWRLVGALNGNFGSLGYLIIGLFVASWLISALIYRLRRYDEIEAAEE